MSAELHTLVGAYALDALDGREQSAFEQHLDSCSICTTELLDFRATVERLGEATAMAPPDGLREQVLTAIRRTPQRRPVVTMVPLSRWRRYSSTLLAAAAVLAIAAVGALYIGERNRGEELTAERDQVEAIMNAPDRVITPRGEAPLQVISSTSLDQAVVLFEDLPDISEQQSYELWAIDAEGAARSLGSTVGSDERGTESGTELADGLADANAVAVTVEQAGGSPTGQPTTTPVETVDLT